MSVEDARAALAGLEGKLYDALDRRDKIIVETVRTSDKAAAGDQSARNSLGPLNKQAKAIDSEMTFPGECTLLLLWKSGTREQQRPAFPRKRQDQRAEFRNPILRLPAPPHKGGVLVCPISWFNKQTCSLCLNSSRIMAAPSQLDSPAGLA
jgi:hypothetical protein